MQRDCRINQKRKRSFFKKLLKLSSEFDIDIDWKKSGYNNAFLALMPFDVKKFRSELLDLKVNNEPFLPLNKRFFMKTSDRTETIVSADDVFNIISPDFKRDRGVCHEREMLVDGEFLFVNYFEVVCGKINLEELDPSILIIFFAEAQIVSFCKQHKNELLEYDNNSSFLFLCKSDNIYIVQVRVVKRHGIGYLKISRH